MEEGLFIDYISDKIMEFLVVIKQRGISKDDLTNGTQQLIKDDLRVTDEYINADNGILDLFIKYFDLALTQLIDKKYLTFSKDIPQYAYGLTTKGRIFINKGGYRGDRENKDGKILKSIEAHRLNKLIAFGVLPAALYYILEVIKFSQDEQHFPIPYILGIASTLLLAVYLFVYRSRRIK